MGLFKVVKQLEFYMLFANKKQRAEPERVGGGSGEVTRIVDSQRIVRQIELKSLL